MYYFIRIYTVHLKKKKIGTGNCVGYKCTGQLCNSTHKVVRLLWCCFLIANDMKVCINTTLLMPGLYIPKTISCIAVAISSC